MKRLLAQIGITTFSVLAAAFYLSDKTVVIVGAAALLLAVVFLVVAKTRRTIFLPAMAIAAALACAVHIGYSFLIVQPFTARYGGAAHTVEAVLTDEPYQSYSKYYYRLKTKEIDGEPVSRKLLLKSAAALDAEPDDVLTFTSDLNVTDNNYYRAKGYFLVSDSFDTVVETRSATSHSLYYYAIQLRQGMRRALDAYLPEDCAALCKAVLIGDKYALDPEVRDNFRYAGASYFIVVSGMHFAVICLLMMKLMRRFNRWVRLALMLVFIVLYAAVTGFQPSVLRSGIMMAILVIGRTVRRQTYPLNHLGIAGILMPLIVSPYGAGDIGLILSYYVTLAILLWAEPIAKRLCCKDAYGSIPQFRPGAHFHASFERMKERIKEKKPRKKEPKEPFDFRLFLKKLWNAFAMLLSVSLAANILAFPLSVIVFRSFSLVTLLSAVLLYAEIYLILLLAFAVSILYWIAPLRFLALLLSWPLYLLCRLVLWLVDGIGSLPFAYIRVGSSWFYVWLAATIVLGVVVLLYRNHYRYLKAAAFCSTMILLAGVLTGAILQTQVLSLEVYSCGSGLCAAVNSGGKLHLISVDADSIYLYRLWEDFSARFGGAESALCMNQDDLKRISLYREDEFAISTVLLYDKDGTYSEDDGVVPFDKDSVFLLDDDLTLTLAVHGRTVVPYLTADEKHILIVPEGCSFEDIPAGMRQADVIVLSTAVAGTENLRCNEMIISDESETALRTADALKDCYRQVYFTDQGTVTLSLR